MTSRVATFSFTSLLAFGACGAFVACGGSSSSEDAGNSEDSANGGTSGSAGTSVSGSSGSAGASTGGRGGSGTSGTAGKGGAAGSGAVGGSTVGGSAGTVAGGGVSGLGGSGGAGQGGQAGGGRECETADDCMRFADCCTCMAVPIGTMVADCGLGCGEDQCFEAGITPSDVTCAFGRCVIDRSCNHALATCDETPEPCPDGQVRLLDDGCFGECLPATECRDVTDCASCGDAVCVIEEPQIRTVGCVDPGSSCTKGSYCDCLDACPPAGFVCMEADDAVHCPCPVC